MSEQVVADDDIMDFTPKQKAPRFRIGEDIFTGVIEIPAEYALDFSTKAERFSDTDQTPSERLELIKELITIILVPESAAKFNARLSSSENPIGLTAFREVLPWLFKRYSGTPTTPDSDSSSGPGNQDSGKSSTENT